MLQLPNDYGAPNDQEERLWKLQINILDSQERCGYGNITINGQILEQRFDGETGVGRGIFHTPQMGAVSATGTFGCIKGDGGPQAQRLDFKVHYLDGEPVEHIGFTVIFRQTTPTEIIAMYTTNRSAPGDRHRGAVYHQHHREVERLKIVELQRMEAHLQDVELLIAEKKQALAEYRCENIDDNCNSENLKGVWRAATDQARKITHSVFGNTGGSWEGRYPPHRGPRPYDPSQPVRLMPITPNQEKDRPHRVHFRPSHMSPRPHFGHRGKHRQIFAAFWDTIMVAKIVAIIYLLAWVVVAIHRRKCTRNKSEAFQARREERRNRRDRHREAMRQMLCRLRERLSGRTSNAIPSDDIDEKREELLSDMESGMTEELTQLRNVADVVGDMVSEEEG